jgi:hypothetical protein
MAYHQINSEAQLDGTCVSIAHIVIPRGCVQHFHGDRSLGGQSEINRGGTRAVRRNPPDLDSSDFHP